MVRVNRFGVMMIALAIVVGVFDWILFAKNDYAGCMSLAAMFSGTLWVLSANHPLDD